MRSCNRSNNVGGMVMDNDNLIVDRKAKRNHAARIDQFEIVGDGMVQSTVSLKGHGACITVIGDDLTECVARTTIILDAFKETKQ